MEESILKLLGEPGYAPSNIPELLTQLQLRANQQQQLQACLEQLVKAGEIIRTKGNRYIVSREADLIPGVIQITRGRRGFVQPDEPGIGEITIAEQNTGTAMHGDRVLVRQDKRARGLRKATPETNNGTVVRILERKRTQFVGTLQRGKQFLHVTPDDPRLPSAVYVQEPRDVGRKAHVGDKVVVEILEWGSPHVAPEGEVVEVLGPPDEEGVDMLSVLRHYALPLHFPKPVLQQANTIAKSRPDNQPSPEECADRVDCRSHNVVTIDPDDAKDFDDAICIERVSKTKWKLWVHIADVSHYVRPGSQLDIEAKKRGNSTYLVDRVIPMLPEALSNELCSLKPDVDRLTKCVEFMLSNDGDVISTKFYSGVIRSKRRFTYKEAFAILQKVPTNETEQMLHDANEMAQRIRQARFRAGSLDLDFPENKIRLDEHGKVLRIERIENDVSHQLIEEYMLLANEAVATHLMRKNKPAIYRIHESPKEKRLQEYRDDVLSHKIPCGDLNHRPEVQKLLAKLSSLSVGPALKIGFLKSLMRARYSTEPMGHYGLAKKKYTHFTSPIRRYADLVVHRALFDHHELSIAAMKQVSDHITDTERNSSDAERDSKEVKLYAYLKAQIESGELVPYPALVTDLRNFGFFVDVTDLGMSGLVPLSSIEDDFFIFEPDRNQIVGRRSHRVIRMGNQVTVQVYKVDSFKKQVDFRLAVEDRVGDRRRDRAPERSGESGWKQRKKSKFSNEREERDGHRRRSKTDERMEVSAYQRTEGLKRPNQQRHKSGRDLAVEPLPAPAPKEKKPRENAAKRKPTKDNQAKNRKSNNKGRSNLGTENTDVFTAQTNPQQPKPKTKSSKGTQRRDLAPEAERPTETAPKGSKRGFWSNVKSGIRKAIAGTSEPGAKPKLDKPKRQDRQRPDKGR